MSEFERLNAFVDGELPATEAAAITARLAADPALAAQVARLRTLKAQVADLAQEPPPFVFTPPKPAVQPAPRSRAWMILPVAASICLAFGLTWTLRSGPEVLPEAVALAPADHAAERRVMTRFDFLPVPQLASAPHVRGYQGARGCVLTIVEGPRTELAALQLSQAPQQSHLWESGESARLILAENMDADRFAFFAQILSDLWLGHSGSEEKALIAQAPNGAPCVS